MQPSLEKAAAINAARTAHYGGDSPAPAQAPYADRIMAVISDRISDLSLIADRLNCVVGRLYGQEGTPQALASGGGKSRVEVVPSGFLSALDQSLDTMANLESVIMDTVSRLEHFV